MDIPAHVIRTTTRGYNPPMKKRWISNPGLGTQTTVAQRQAKLLQNYTHLTCLCPSNATTICSKHSARHAQSSCSEALELLHPFAVRIFRFDEVKKGGRLLLVSEYWMRHGLFRTNCDGMGRVAAATSSHRFTPSILKLLDYTRREIGQGRQAGRSSKENDSNSFQEVKLGECEKEEVRNL